VKFMKIFATVSLVFILGLSACQ